MLIKMGLKIFVNRRNLNELGFTLMFLILKPLGVTVLIPRHLAGKQQPNTTVKSCPIQLVHTLFEDKCHSSRALLLYPQN